MHFGTQYGDSLQEFVSIPAVAVGRNGEVLIADAVAGRIRVFDPDGGYRKTIGRRGPGPGEFTRIRAMHVHGDTLIVLDADGPTVTVMDWVEGKLFRTFRVEAAQGDAYFGNGAQIRIVEDTLVAFGVGGLVDPLDGRRHDELRIYSLRGRLVDSLVIARQPIPRKQFIARDGRQFGVPIRFSPWRIWTINASGGLTIAHGAAYRIAELDRAGDTARVMSRDVQPEPIDADAREAARNWTDLMVVGFGGDLAASPYELPGAQPYIFSLSYGQEGKQLWIKRTELAADPVYDVFVEGNYRCRVRLLAAGYRATINSVPLVVANGILLHVAIDSLDAQYVLGYRQRSSAGLTKCVR